MPSNIDRYLQELTALRQKLHALAELSGAEVKTSEAVHEFLKTTSPDTIQTKVGGHGILATYGAENEGPHLLIRCELDALPISDVSEVEYRSQTEGVGHKCGHDGHMAIVCGVAQMLDHTPPVKGTVTLLFQPAEETGEGARKVLGDPRFKEINPDYCFALHNIPDYPKHQIVVRKDVFAAASVGVIVHFKGATAHAAHPEQGRSPALAMAQTVQAFSGVSQFYTPLEKAAKVTVVNVSMGERAFGTSPGKATVMATLRTYENDLLEELKERCVQIASRTAETYDLSVDHEWVEPFPSTVNSSEATKAIASAAESLDKEIHWKAHPFSWSEDFGHFTKEIGGAMFGLGSGENQPALHAENYDFPDDLIATGVSMFMEIINEVTNKK